MIKNIVLRKSAAHTQSIAISALRALTTTLALAISLAIFTPTQAQAQQAEPFDAARVPSKPLRLEDPRSEEEPASEKPAPNKPAPHELAPGVTDDHTNRRFYFAPKVVTVFPLLLGAGVEASYRNKLALGVSYGITPRAYSKALAEAAAAIANEPSYKKVIEAAFNHNNLIRAYAEYRFRRGDNGFQLGTAYTHLKADGSAPIDDVLEQPTGILYTLLKNLLIAQGKDPNVNMKSDLGLAEIYAGYGFTIVKNLTFAFDLGIAKVISSDIKLSTEAPSYDNSAQGKTQLRQSESDLEKILKDNGLTPTLGLRLGYTF